MLNQAQGKRGVGSEKVEKVENVEFLHVLWRSDPTKSGKCGIRQRAGGGKVARVCFNKCSWAGYPSLKIQCPWPHGAPGLKKVSLAPGALGLKTRVPAAPTPWPHGTPDLRTSVPGPWCLG